MMKKFSPLVTSSLRKQRCALSAASPLPAATATRSFFGLVRNKEKSRGEPVTKGFVSPSLSVPKHIPYPEYALGGPPGNAGNAIYLHSAEEVPKLRRAARLARKMLEYGLSLAAPGVTTDEIDRRVHEEIVKHGAYPSPLHYAGFPKSICTSVNEVVCHGIPDSRALREGDIISIDVSLFLDGFHGDNCGTVVVGKGDAKLEDLVQTTKDAVQKAIDVCRPGACFSQIGRAIQKHADSKGYHIIHEFCGHGVGKYLHMKPYVLHFDNKERITMKPGMCFTIEPILAERDNEMFIWNDRWTAATKEGGWSAQIEHQVLITDDGVEVLTVLE